MSHRRMVSPDRALVQLMHQTETRLARMVACQEWARSGEPVAVSNTGTPGVCTAGEAFSTVLGPGANFVKFSGVATGVSPASMVELRLLRDGVLVGSSTMKTRELAPQTEMSVMWAGSDFEDTRYVVTVVGNVTFTGCTVVLRRRP